MAVANYADHYGSLPPAYVLGPDGRPWHSWRALVLPFLEQQELYAAYNFDEPWDGPNNRKLAAQVVKTFQRPEDDGRSPYTRFVAVIGDGTAFPGATARTTAEICDGLSSTLLFVEVVGSDIHCSEPRDLPFDQLRCDDSPRRGTMAVGSPFDRARAALADGRIITIREDTRVHDLRALATIDGGEIVTEDEPGAWVVRGRP